MKILLTNKTYDILKWVCLIGLPALSVLAATLGEIWGVAHVREAVLSINALATFLGALLGVSSAQYNRANGNG